MFYCVETRNRILVALAAYSYEILSSPVITDSEYDSLAKKIDPSLETNNSEMDFFFKTEFGPNTGQWIYKHPQKEGLEKILSSTKRFKIGS